MLGAWESVPDNEDCSKESNEIPDAASRPIAADESPSMEYISSDGKQEKELEPDDDPEKNESQGREIRNASAEQTSLSAASESEPLRSDSELACPIEIERQLLKIEIAFEEKRKSSELKVVPPDFETLPDRDFIDRHFVQSWHTIKQKYAYASKVNELDPKHGRIREIAANLRLHKDEYSSLPHIRTNLAYMHYLCGQTSDAMEELEWEIQYFRSSLEGATYLNAAFFATELGEPIKALFYLESYFFATFDPSSDANAWFVLLDLILTTGISACFHLLNRHAEENREMLYESLVYVLLRGKDRS